MRGVSRIGRGEGGVRSPAGVRRAEEMEPQGAAGGGRGLQGAAGEAP